MELAEFTRMLPKDYHKTISHLWLVTDEGKLEVVPKQTATEESEYNPDAYYVHAEKWGEDAWDNPTRGYFSPEHAIVHSHGYVNNDIVKQLARAFRDAVYIHTH